VWIKRETNFMTPDYDRKPKTHHTKKTTGRRKGDKRSLGNKKVKQLKRRKVRKKGRPPAQTFPLTGLYAPTDTRKRERWSKIGGKEQRSKRPRTRGLWN